ncbi:hypothetical protein SAMN04488040_0925 [Sulfitobacter marinus]|uniref:Tat (Twin-arginine translocation) pathway signal sequence n=1 Tax=Sulfitobacter marinus TaxID=394264 RepID=A0A1I6QTJ5_9RHOB|nr:hypothetical protein [Sulfitobacter marinus]SFS55710.1 hypothetical protein SAMN04488040_0925 [Sulfitobacter marinus]
MPRFRFAFLAVPLVLSAQIACAQQSDTGGHIAVELNAAESSAEACTLSFMITNGMKTPVDKLVYEVALFDKAGQVSRLTLFDFGTLPPERPRVRQFAVPQISCDDLGRVLFNGASTCEGDGIAPDACETGLRPSSRADIEVLG